MIYRLLQTRFNWSQNLVLDPYSRNDLQWWFDSVSQWNVLVVVNKHIGIQLTTDASGTGWGAWIPQHEAQGFWNNRIATQSSNYRELLPVLMGLLSFRE